MLVFSVKQSVVEPTIACTNIVKILAGINISPIDAIRKSKRRPNSVWILAVIDISSIIFESKARFCAVRILTVIYIGPIVVIREFKRFILA